MSARRCVTISPWASLEADCLRTVLEASGMATVPPDHPAGILVVAVPRYSHSAPQEVVLQTDWRRLPTLLLVEIVEPWNAALSRAIGAAGVISWRAPAGTLLKAVRRVLNGRSVPRDPTLAIADPFLALSGRERDVMALVTLGHQDRDIAVELRLSVHTVRSHVQNSLAKLDLTHRSAAAASARRSTVIRQFF